MPDSKYLGPAEIEVTSFHGITPGASTRDDVEKAWGKPKESRKLDSGLMQLYSVDPFPRVEVAYSGDNKVTSLVIRFEHGFPAAQVAEQLELSKVQPVLVSNELGEVLGQSYPERGVLFSFEPATDPSKALKKVTHIVLEPITAEPFVLRAETNIDIRPEFSLHDADQAIKLQPGNARAQWLRSRALTRWASTSRPRWPRPRRSASNPATPATRSPRPRPCSSRPDCRGRRPEAEKAIAMSESAAPRQGPGVVPAGRSERLPVRKPDYKQALQLHTQALQAADDLVCRQASGDPHRRQGSAAGRPSRRPARHCLGRLAREGAFRRELGRQGHGNRPRPDQDRGRQRGVSLPPRHAGPGGRRRPARQARSGEMGRRSGAERRGA